MSAESSRYANQIHADIQSLSQEIANRRSLVEGERALLEADERRLAELTTLLEHIGKAES